MGDARLTGERIAYHRKRLGMSQAEFAGLISRSDSWVSQVERGVRAVDRLSVLQRVADALGVSADELHGSEGGEAAAGSGSSGAFDALRLAITGHPAIGAVLGTGARAITTERLSELQDDLHLKVWPMVHATQYSDLAPIATALIGELEEAVRVTADPRLVETARELLGDTYQAVSAMMGKLGESDAAWIAADRATFVAEAENDPLALGASLFRMAHTFLSLGLIAQVIAVARPAVASLEQRASEDATLEVLSLLGGFYLVLAIAGARDDDRAEAYSRLRQAQGVAARLGEDRNDFGTEFGPTNVALHAVGVAVELGDAGEALDLAAGTVAERLSPERQARYLLDVAQAHAMRRQIGEAVRCLERADDLAPEQVRSHRLARNVTRDLIQLSGTRPSPGLRQLAERFGVIP